LSLLVVTVLQTTTTYLVFAGRIFEVLRNLITLSTFAVISVSPRTLRV
jgi:hypothetical protein